MYWLWMIVGLWVVLGSVLAMAETSMSRMTKVRAMALRNAGHRNAEILSRIEGDPTRYLNSIYLCLMIVQNGSAIFVAVLAEQTFGELWVTVLSFAFTIAYFVVVEAMSKTFGILRAVEVALALAPMVWAIGRALSAPTRALIGLANVLLPGKGLKEGPFVTPEEIRSMAEVGQQEGTVGEQEREIIHSVFDLGDIVVRKVMVPRPDIVAAPITSTSQQILDLMLAKGHWRIPVYREDPADVQGVVYAEDLLEQLRAGVMAGTVESVMHEPYVVPETKRAADLLKEMQARRVHIAIVVDEYGSTAGLVTIKDIIEELVGDIADEYEKEEIGVEKVSEGTYRVGGDCPIDNLSMVLGVELPEAEANTVGGLVYGLLGRVPERGETVLCDGVRFTVEDVQRRRIVALRVDLETPK
jgi:CBS domain containing-hemolysin-like protein